MSDIFIDSKNNIVKINGDIISSHAFLQVKFQKGRWSYIISEEDPFTNIVRCNYDNR